MNVWRYRRRWLPRQCFQRTGLREFGLVLTGFEGLGRLNEGWLILTTAHYSMYGDRSEQ